MTRIEQLRTYMEQEGLDGFYIAKPENVRCISGFTGADSFLFITAGMQYFLTDPRYTEQAACECPDYEVIDWRGKARYSMGETLSNLVNKNKIRRIGFEEDYLTYRMWKSIQDTVEAEFVPTINIIEGFRAVKTPEEIRNLTAACDIASRAFEKIIREIRVGMTEKEIAARLDHYMVMEGADTKPYGGIVVTGARTSLLHGVPGNTAVEYGDLVLLDYGCQYKGYLSDMTRVVVVGKATDRQKEVYGLCRQMTEDTEAVIRPGVTGTACYEASLTAIRDTEYYPYHYSGIGHGVGLFLHELPNLGLKCENILARDQVLTVEPGIYIPGWGGVRVEDQGIVTKDGYKNLISATHELIEL